MINEVLENTEFEGGENVDKKSTGGSHMGFLLIILILGSIVLYGTLYTFGFKNIEQDRGLYQSHDEGHHDEHATGGADEEHTEHEEEVH